MLRTAVVLFLALAAALPAFAEGPHSVRREKRQDRRELHRDARETANDQKDAARFSLLLKELTAAHRKNDAAAIASVDHRVLVALGAEVGESRGELGRDRAEVRRDGREVRRERTEDRRERRDDRRDRRDDVRDASAERGELARTAALRAAYQPLAGKTDAASLGKKQAILKQLAAMERREVKRDHRELREDKRELREDRRDLREERRQRRR